MRKVVLYTLTSLDGAVEDPRRYFPDSNSTVASAPVFDPVMADLEAQLIVNQDAVLLGRNTFDEWSRYWPTSDEQPFADFINSVKKYVVTSTPLTNSWGHAEAVAGPVVDVVRDLKARPGGHIGPHGSIDWCRHVRCLGRGCPGRLRSGREARRRYPASGDHGARSRCGSPPGLVGGGTPRRAMSMA